MRKILQNNNGMTLVELMIVVAIIGILSMVAFPAYDGITEKAEEKTCAANIRAVKNVYFTLKLNLDPTYKKFSLTSAYLSDIENRCPDGFIDSAQSQIKELTRKYNTSGGSQYSGLKCPTLERTKTKTKEERVQAYYLINLETGEVFCRCHKPISD